MLSVFFVLSRFADVFLVHFLAVLSPLGFARAPVLLTQSFKFLAPQTFFLLHSLVQLVLSTTKQKSCSLSHINDTDEELTIEVATALSSPRHCPSSKYVDQFAKSKNKIPENRNSNV